MSTDENPVNDDHGVTVTAQTMQGNADDQRIDDWELRSSRRALKYLRTLLYGQKMLELIGPDMEKHDELFRGYVEQSEGKWTECRDVIDVRGLTLAQFGAFFQDVQRQLHTNSGQSSTTDADAKREYVERVLFPTHPEHLAIIADSSGVAGIETMGGLPMRSANMIDNPPDQPDWLQAAKDPSYPMAVSAHDTLFDKVTPHTWSLTMAKPTDDGLRIDVRVWYPAACPKAYIEDHSRHLAVEFRNSLRLAAANSQDTAAA